MHNPDPKRLILDVKKCSFIYRWRKAFYLQSRLSIKSFSTVQSKGVLAILQILKPAVRTAFDKEPAIYLTKMFVRSMILT